MKDLIPGNTEGMRPDELAFLATLEEAPTEETETPEEAVADPEPVETDEEATDHEPEEDSPETSEDQDDEPEGTPEDSIEEVTTADGKRIKIDYSDRDRIKRAHLLARQGRVWQSERDSARKELEAIKPEFDEIKGVLDALEDAKDDPAELYRLITGGQDWEELIEKEIAQREEVANLTPAQLEVYNKHKIAEKREAELRKREAAWEKKLEDAQRKEEEAARSNQSAMFKSAFNEFRFAGTLGDKVKEHKLDKKVWNNIKAELHGKDLNDFEVREIIKAEFDDLRSLINVAGKKAATKARGSKIAKATKKAAQGVNEKSNETSEVSEMLRKGDIQGILSMDNWADLVNKL